MPCVRDGLRGTCRPTSSMPAIVMIRSAIAARGQVPASLVRIEPGDDVRRVPLERGRDDATGCDHHVVRDRAFERISIDRMREGPPEVHVRHHGCAWSNPKYRTTQPAPRWASSRTVGTRSASFGV